MEYPDIKSENSSQSQYKVEVKKVNYVNEENGWSVLKVMDVSNSLEFVATGHFTNINSGDFLLLMGTWVSHKNFGKQLKVDKAVHCRPNSRDGIIRYLSSGLFKGIGEKTARKIVQNLGLKTFEILDEDPEQLKIVPKLGKRAAANIIDSWNSHKVDNEILMFLYRHGITGSTAQKVMKRFGDETIETISKNPYQLIKAIRGVGFLTADKIARSIGLELDHPQRIQEGILYILNLAEEQGHCYTDSKKLIEQIESVLNLTQDQAQTSLGTNLISLEQELRIVSLSEKVSENFSEDSNAKLHYLESLYLCELGVANNITRILKADFQTMDPMSPRFQERVETWINQYTKKKSISLNEEQLLAVKKAVKSKILILTGGPGVGKTTTANTIIRLFKAMGKHVVLAAPTGRAAQRLSEVSGEPAKTIHRLLEWSAMEFSFKKNSDNKLSAQVVIIDESSMLDVRLAHSLLEAIPEHAQVIFIGDVDQLPPIGPGYILRDFIQSQKVPYQILKKVFRQAQSSKIIEISHAINTGKMPIFSDEPQSDCRLLEAHQSDDITDILEKLLKDFLPKAGYDSITQVQILTPMHKGSLGSVQLNLSAQEWLNPKSSGPEWVKTKMKLRPNDKVIQQVNNYDLGVYNGDIGFVKYTNVEGGKLLIRFGDKDVYYDEEQSRDLSLAYAITIHKSQGSEFPVVIIPLSMSHYTMLQRNLIYTALTRAKKLAIFIGEKKALFFAIKNLKSTQRRTRLSEILSSDIN